MAAGHPLSAEMVHLWQREKKTEESREEKSPSKAGERESGEDGEAVETARFS